MTFPSEIFSDVFSFLPKGSLKRFRLVCRVFYEIATPLLFNSIFVSDRQVDREVAALIALKFSNSIETLTFSSECYHEFQWSQIYSELKDRFSSCRCDNFASHLQQAKIYFELYCKLRSEQVNSYKSGAVQYQLTHLLNSLPNLRQIIITDRRRRLDLSWSQEASLGKSLTSRGYRTMLNLFERPPIACDCIDVDLLLPYYLENFFSSSHTGRLRISHNPWATIILALHKSSNALIHNISIQPKNANSCLAVAAVDDDHPDNPISPATRVPSLTHL